MSLLEGGFLVLDENQKVLDVIKGGFLVKWPVSHASKHEK